MKTAKYLIALVIISLTSSSTLQSTTDFLPKIFSFFQPKKEYETERIKALRAERQKFKDWFRLPTSYECADMLFLPIFHVRDIRDNPTMFLQYIYHVTDYDSKEIDFNRDWFLSSRFYHKLLTVPESLAASPRDARWMKNMRSACIKTKIHHLSALGAAVIAKNLSRDKKQELIDYLLKIGFKPTEKDRQLAYLELYETTPLDTERKFLLALGKNDPKSPLSKLPIEVIRHISSFIRSEKSLLA